MRNENKLCFEKYSLVMKKWILIFLFVFTTGLAQSQYYCCDYCGTPVIWTEDEAKAFFLDILSPVFDTIPDTTFYYVSNLDSITKMFGMSFDEFAKIFLLNAEKLDTTKRLTPEYIYFNYFLPLMQSGDKAFGKRWVSDFFELYIVSSEKIDSTKRPVRKLSHPTSYNENMDLLFVCIGDENTNLFIKSKNLVENYLVKIFEYIHHVNDTSGNKIKGVNFYFPDYNFRENRAMAQFAKSASLVIDSTKLKTIRGMRLYFSFDDKKDYQEESFLSCLTEMCDSVFLFNTSYDSTLFYPFVIYDANSAKGLPVYYKVANQFRLARFSLGAFPANTSKTEFIPDEIKAIANSDYPNNDWETYLIALLSIVLIVILIIILYWTIPEFSYYLNKNKDYMITLILILCFEVFLILFTTVEAMSRTDVFNFTDNNKYMILFLPLLLIFITPVFKVIRTKRSVP